MVNAVQNHHIDETGCAEIDQKGLAAGAIRHTQHLGEIGSPASLQDAVQVQPVRTHREIPDGVGAGLVARPVNQVLGEPDVGVLACSAPERVAPGETPEGSY